jgi:hypothetical protein
VGTKIGLNDKTALAKTAITIRPVYHRKARPLSRRSSSSTDPEHRPLGAARADIHPAMLASTQ